MSDPVQIQGSISIDGDGRWFEGDAAPIEVTVLDAFTKKGVEGVVTAKLVNDLNRVVEIRSTRTASDGTASFSLTPSTPGLYDLRVHYQDQNGRAGKSLVGSYRVWMTDAQTPTDGESLTGQLNYDQSEPDYSITIVVI
jgi:hypothetical protein